MKSWVRFTAAALAVGVAVPLLGVVSPSPASAASFDQIIDLWNYKILKTGTELQAAMGPVAAAAWGPETARVAARSTSAYSIAAATSGLTNVHPDPIYIRPQDLPQIKPVGGLKNYTTKFTGVGLNKPLAVGGAFVAMTAFEYRAEFADGVTSWIGMDATSAVCGDPVASGGFVNFITGQDCDAYELAKSYSPNADVVPRADGWLDNLYVTGSPGDGGPVYGYYFSCGLGGPFVGGVVSQTYVCVVQDGSENQDFSDLGSRVTCKRSSDGLLSKNGAIRFSRGRYTKLTYAPISLTFGCDDGWTVYSVNSSRMVGGVVGSPEYDAGVSADPARHWECTYTGSNGVEYSASSGTFTEGSGSLAAPVCPALPAGVSAAHMTISLVGGGKSTVVSDQDVLPDPLGDGSQTNGVTTAYCQTNVCVLELMDLRTNKSCFDEGDACDGWLQSPTRDADYRCFYGGVQQDFKQCYVYAQVFNTAKRLAGEPYADPKTGEDTGTKSGLSIDELTMANSPRPAAFGRNCFGGDWGASNPVNWVLRPIQCALEWAFAARPAVVTANAEVVRSAWSNTAPGEVVAVVGGWGFPAGSTGCAGPAVDIPFLGLSGYPLSACSGTFLAPMASAVKIMLSVMLVLGGAFAVVRMVSGVIGYRGIDE